MSDIDSNKCERLVHSDMYGQSSSCDEMFTCCDCGGNDCGCAYCWSCNACETCLTDID